MIVTSIVGLLLFLPASAADAVDREPAYNRWAIVASEAPGLQALSDLITVELVNLRGLEVVERGRLEAIADELALSAILGADAVDRRLALGRILQADALILLDVEQANGKDVVKLIISDCRHGARLHFEVIPLSEDALPRIATRVMNIVRRTREQFRTGIERIVAVTPFVSRNLLHDHDHLQQGFAHLIEGALASVPGLAVLELDEARAIGRERALTGTAIRRVVPVLLNGEFEVTGDAGGGDRTVKLRVGASNGNEIVYEVHREFPSVEAASEFLTGQATAAILGRIGRRVDAPLTVDAQFDRLAARADTFAELGSWDSSTGLREAALLLRPGDGTQRLRLAEEYSHFVTGQRVDMSAAQSRERVEAWRRGLEHFEHVIRNATLTQEQAVALARVVLLSPSNARRIWMRFPTLERSREALEQQKREFLLKVYPRVLALAESQRYRTTFRSSGPDRRLLRYSDWQRSLFRAALAPLNARPGVHLTYDNLHFIQRLLEEVTTDVPVIPTAPVQFIRAMSSSKSLTRPGFTSDEYVAFLEKLAASRKPVNALMGRFGLLYRAWQTGRDKPEYAPQALLQQVQAVEREFLELVHPALRYSLNSDLGYLKSEVEKDLRASRTVTGDLGAGTREPARLRGQRLPPKHYAQGRLRFEPITTEVRRVWITTEVPVRQNSATRRRAGTRRRRPPNETDVRTAPGPTTRRRAEGTQVRRRSNTADAPTNPGSRLIRRHPRRPIGSLALLKCRDGLDVLHNAASILLHRQAGLFEEVLFEPDAHLTGIVWDNGYIWAGSTAKGIFVLNEAGDVVARIGKEAGLPPADHGMKLCRVGLHEVVAVGSFGPNDRAWCALVTYRESKPQVEVFHTATNAVIFSRSGPARLDPQTAFRPEWVVPHPDETGQETNRVLVGRGVVLSRPGKSTNLFPSLQIDVRSRTVSVPRGPELDWIRRWQPTHHLLPNGNVIIPYRSEVRVQPPPTRERIVGSRVLFGIDRDYGLSRRLVVHDGFFYVTGVTWFRIDPRTLDVERLVPGFLPKAHQLGTGVSGHFGLVQWNRHLEFFRVIVGDSMPTTRRNTSTERVKQ